MNKCLNIAGLLYDPQLFWRRGPVLCGLGLRGQQGLHLPRQEGRAHRRPQRPHQDCELCRLEPRVPSGWKFKIKTRFYTAALFPFNALLQAYFRWIPEIAECIAVSLQIFQIQTRFSKASPVDIESNLF